MNIKRAGADQLEWVYLQCTKTLGLTDRFFFFMFVCCCFFSITTSLIYCSVSLTPAIFKAEVLLLLCSDARGETGWSKRTIVNASWFQSEVQQDWNVRSDLKFCLNKNRRIELFIFSIFNDASCLCHILICFSFLLSQLYTRQIWDRHFAE